jgi:hypothetical protein
VEDASDFIFTPEDDVRDAWHVVDRMLDKGRMTRDQAMSLFGLKRVLADGTVAMSGQRVAARQMPGRAGVLRQITHHCYSDRRKNHYTIGIRFEDGYFDEYLPDDVVWL